MTIEEYLQNINTRYQTGISREHSYRGDLQTLLEAMLDGVLVTNEPSRIECGAPDIGSYQSAQKWLKDRRDRKLSFEAIRHYRKIIVALMETDRIMQEIDEVGVEGQ